MPLKKSPSTSSGVIVPAPQRTALARRPQSNVAIQGFGNVTQEDMTVPRLKLLQGLSPEVQENARRFFPGEFYHSALGDMIGKELVVVPLQINRSHELWAPREDDQGLLARSTDGFHWDKPHTKFDVRINGKKHVWDTKGSVPESGLAEWGTSNPSKERSPPAAALTYRTVLYLPENEDIGGLCLMISSRMATKSIQDLITRVSARHHGGTPFWCQKYALTAPEMVRGPNRFYVPSFRNEGNITDKDQRDSLEAMAKAMENRNIRSEDDRVEEEAPAHAPAY